MPFKFSEGNCLYDILKQYSNQFPDNYLANNKLKIHNFSGFVKMKIILSLKGFLTAVALWKLVLCFHLKAISKSSKVFDIFIVPGLLTSFFPQNSVCVCMFLYVMNSVKEATASYI